MRGPRRWCHCEVSPEVGDSPTVARVRRFYACQQRSRRWLNFALIADWCARQSGSVKPDEGDRIAAYQQLYRGVLEQEFERNEKSLLLFLGSADSSNGRWSRDDLATAIYAAGTKVDGFVAQNILACCWIPNEMARAWLAKRNLPLAPHLFPIEPRSLTSTNNNLIVWMRDYAQKAIEKRGVPCKRDDALDACQRATKCTYREARTAWNELPSDLKRKARRAVPN